MYKHIFIFSSNKTTLIVYRICNYEYNIFDVCIYIYGIKLMKGKSPRKHCLLEKTAASVLLKMFLSGNE